MLRDESATTSLQTSHNSLRQLGQFGGRVVGVVGLLSVKGRREVKHRESPASTSEVGISAFFDRHFFHATKVGRFLGMVMYDK